MVGIPNQRRGGVQTASPFNQLPNSYGNNPGNEFSIFYPGASDAYGWGGNYAPSAWSCQDDDGDQLKNAYEDKNGNLLFAMAESWVYQFNGTGFERVF